MMTYLQKMNTFSQISECLKARSLAKMGIWQAPSANQSLCGDLLAGPLITVVLLCKVNVGNLCS